MFTMYTVYKWFALHTYILCICLNILFTWMHTCSKHAVAIWFGIKSEHMWFEELSRFTWMVLSILIHQEPTYTKIEWPPSVLLWLTQVCEREKLGRGAARWKHRPDRCRCADSPCCLGRALTWSQLKKQFPSGRMMENSWKHEMSSMQSTWIRTSWSSESFEVAKGCFVLHFRVNVYTTWCF